MGRFQNYSELFQNKLYEKGFFKNKSDTEKGGVAL